MGGVRLYMGTGKGDHVIFFVTCLEGGWGVSPCRDITENGGSRLVVLCHIRVVIEWDRHSQCMYWSGALLKMPATRSYETIVKEMEDYLVRLEDEWAHVQHKHMKHKKQKVRKKMKEQMDLILKVNLKLQTCKQSLEATHLVHGNSIERQRMKEMEVRLLDIDKLMEFFSQF